MNKIKKNNIEKYIIGFKISRFFFQNIIDKKIINIDLGVIDSENKKSLTCPCCRRDITTIKLVNKIEMNNIKNLVNVPQQDNMRERRRPESRFSEIRLYERRQERFIIVRQTEARI